MLTLRTMFGLAQQVQQQSLRIGDIVFLYSAEEEGYVFSECSRYIIIGRLDPLDIYSNARMHAYLCSYSTHHLVAFPVTSLNDPALPDMTSEYSLIIGQ